MRSLVLGVIALNLWANASAQSLLSHRTYYGPIVIIDPSRGSLTPVGPDVGQVGPLTTFDQQRQRLFYAVNDVLFFIDFTRRTTGTVPAAVRDYAGIAYDSLGDHVLAIISTVPPRVIAISPHSGSVTQIATIQTVGLRYGVIAFDVAGRRLFLSTGNGNPEEITTVNVETGAVSTSSLALTGGFFFEFDPMTAKVLALSGGTQPRFLAVDPATGVETVLLSSDWSVVGTPLQGVSAFDVARRRLYLSGIDTSVFPFQAIVVTADFSNQTVIARRVGATSFGAGLLDFLEVGSISASVPTLSSFAVVALALLLALVGIRAARL